MVRALRRSERRVSPRLSLKTIVIPVLFVNILYTVEVVPFLGMMLVEIALLTITVLAGLAIKFVASIYRRDFKKGLAPGLDNLVSELLVRKRVSSTFFRLYLWNLSIALLLISVGFITFGTFPLVWAFLTLGLAAPSLGSFKGRPHLGGYSYRPLMILGLSSSQSPRMSLMNRTVLSMNDPGIPGFSGLTSRLNT